MGTSSSGSDPAMGVPIVPPWVPDIPTSPESEPGNEPSEEPSRPAPHGRFGPARTSIGKFARNNAPSNLRRGLGHYVRRGYGGARTMTKRMGGTIRTAKTLYAALSSSTDPQSVEQHDSIDFSKLSGKSADEIMDVLVEVVQPIDGTLDSEASRVSIRDALSNLLDRFPDADMSMLSEEQRLFAVERYIATDIYNLFCRDMGKAIQDKASSAWEALSRLKDVKDYVTEIVSAQFRALGGFHQPLTGTNITHLARHALQQTLEVFEGYVT